MQHNMILFLFTSNYLRCKTIVRYSSILISLLELVQACKLRDFSIPISEFVRRGTLLVQQIICAVIISDSFVKDERSKRHKNILRIYQIQVFPSCKELPLAGHSGS